MRLLEVWQKSRLLMSVFVLLNIKVLMGFILSLKTGCPGLLCNWCSHLFKLNTVECCQNRIFCFRFHLQAFRHLYVLACEPRLFITRDVDTKKICYAPIKVRLKVKLDIIGHAALAEIFLWILLCLFVSPQPRISEIAHQIFLSFWRNLDSHEVRKVLKLDFWEKSFRVWRTHKVPKMANRWDFWSFDRNLINL